MDIAPTCKHSDPTRKSSEPMCMVYASRLNGYEEKTWNAWAKLWLYENRGAFQCLRPITHPLPVPA